MAYVCIFLEYNYRVLITSITGSWNHKTNTFLRTLYPAMTEQYAVGM